MLSQLVITISSKYQHQLGMKHLTCLMDRIIYPKYKIILNIYLKNTNQLVSISPKSLIFLKTMNTEFSEMEVWFTDQNNNALEIEDNVNISLIFDTR